MRDATARGFSDRAHVVYVDVVELPVKRDMRPPTHDELLEVPRSALLEHGTERRLVPVNVRDTQKPHEPGPEYSPVRGAASLGGGFRTRALRPTAKRRRTEVRSHDPPGPITEPAR